PDRQRGQADNAEAGPARAGQRRRPVPGRPQPRDRGSRDRHAGGQRDGQRQRPARGPITSSHAANMRQTPLPAPSSRRRSRVVTVPAAPGSRSSPSRYIVMATASPAPAVRAAAPVSPVNPSSPAPAAVTPLASTPKP